MFVWGSCNAGLLDEIFKVQKRCVRIILDALFLARTLLNQICIYTKSVERSDLKTERSNLEPYSISSLKKRIKMQRAKTYAKIGLSRCKRSNLSAILPFPRQQCTVGRSKSQGALGGSLFPSRRQHG